MTSAAGINADQIAIAVQAGPHIAALASGRFGEITTYLPGRRIRGVRIDPDAVTIGVIGRYPATITDIATGVRAAVGPLDRPVHVRVVDITAGDTGVDNQSNPDERTVRPREENKI